MQRKRYFNNSASQPRLAALGSPFQRKGRVGALPVSLPSSSERGARVMGGAQRRCIRDADAK